MPTALPGGAVQSISGYARSQIAGLAKVLFDIEHFSLIVLPFALIYYDSHLLKNCLGRVFPNKRHHLMSLHVTPGLLDNAFSRVFREIFPREHGLLVKRFVS